jgi:hypothetical protein
MNGITTAADYGWLKERYQSLLEAYCLTLVEDMTPERLLRELGAEPDGQVTGVADLAEPSYDAWDAMLPVHPGRTVVSHFRNVNAVDHFSWWQDGDLRLHFEPLFPTQRDGSHPDELLKEMEQAGFDLSEGDDRDFRRHTEAAFALAERITGVRLTPELFEELEFTCGLVPLA